MPRTLAGALRPFVSFRSRTRGEAYARQGRVSIVHGGPSSVSARVRGSANYEVTLVIDGNLLRPSCDCPYFDGAFEPCKHIWALALTADRQHLMTVPADLEMDSSLDGEAFEDLDVEYVQKQPSATRAPRPAAAASRPPWEAFLAALPPPVAQTQTPGLAAGELLYVFDPVRSTTTQGMYIELLRRQRKKNGEWARPRDVTIARGDVKGLPDEDDREILERVCGAADAWSGAWNIGGALPVPSPFVLTPALQRDLSARLCGTGRLLLRPVGSDGDVSHLAPIAWAADLATFRLAITGAAHSGYTVTGVLDHGGRERPMRDAMFVTRAIVMWRPTDDEGPTLSAFDAVGADRWLAALINVGSVDVPPAGGPQLLEALASSSLPHVTAPDDLRVETRSVSPEPVARISRSRGRATAWAPERLALKVSFAYGPGEVDSAALQPVVFDRASRIAWRRDPSAEHAALEHLARLGVRDLVGQPVGATRNASSGSGRHFELHESALPTVVRDLVASGWRVEADGRAYRRPGLSTLGISSGIDWFELHGQLDFDGVSASLPAVLAAARKGEAFVALDDGSIGLLPDEWLARSLRMASLGEIEGDHVRFQPSQAALVDAWLAEQPAVTWDEPFAKLRAEFANFAGVTAQDPPVTFHGALRDYQRDALGWFAFLRRFGFGGCLADEMGLGKTVMVLAALEARRLEREQAGSPPQPSLIVVPRSLVFNWLQEAARFAPALRMLDATGSQRRDAFDRFGDHDVVVVTYGTLRRDIGQLKDVAFDYAILDEAQAIKNASTAAARAARLLRAAHRLALSGTPVENHLGELWSLFEFLNPGLLGSATAFTGARAVNASGDEEMLSIIGRGLRPFILRRTKEQVASELPPRTEQTLYCDLEPAQRKVYDGLRAHYRASLLGANGRDGTERSTLHVLEALLRLRQAACHPGLIDPAQANGPSAKLDVLLPRLHELVEDGRKVLIFSQFTSLLALLRDRLDASALTYEYLDGRTRNREARVRRFQEGPCPLFLISLKAGGLGLNLTAADYVFLLDPWWNPAVEAQAIDRAHRIGQTRAVFAYRLIARDTVEEKVLELQAGKRQLADAVVRADASLLRDLKREDLELLLS
jgi:superfamily II DNA or RNA helicase